MATTGKAKVRLLKKRQRQVRHARNFVSPVGFSSKRGRKQDLRIRAKNPRRKGVGNSNTGDFASEEELERNSKQTRFFD